MQFLPAFIWQIFMDKKNSAGCLLKTKWLMKICIVRGTQFFSSNCNVQFFHLPLHIKYYISWNNYLNKELGCRNLQEQVWKDNFFFKIAFVRNAPMCACKCPVDHDAIWVAATVIPILEFSDKRLFFDSLTALIRAYLLNEFRKYL